MAPPSSTSTSISTSNSTSNSTSTSTSTSASTSSINITIPHHSIRPSNLHPTPSSRRPTHRRIFSTSSIEDASSSLSVSSSSSSSCAFSSFPQTMMPDREAGHGSPSPSSPTDLTDRDQDQDQEQEQEVVGSSSSSSSSPSGSGLQQSKKHHKKRPSLLSDSLSRSNIHRSVNLAPPDSPPRLVTYLQSGQGFLWNDELFLPSYHSELSRRRRQRQRHGGSGGGGGMEDEADKVDVIDIWVSEEEARGMVPE